LRSESGRREAKDPATRRELRLDPAAAARITAEEIAIEVFRREEYARMLQTTRIKITNIDATHAEWGTEGAHQSSFGRLIRGPEGWVPDK
jgi:hypothetical protein